MKEQKPKKIISLSFRVEENLAKRIKDNADKANRSQSNFVTIILTKALDDIDSQNKLMQ
jgi:predicted transcriptional regulator